MQYIGVDIGGTQLRVGRMEEDGLLTFQHREPTLEGVSSGEDLYRKILGMIRAVPGWASCAGVGIGVPGSVDPAAEEVTIAENLRVLERLPLARRLREDLGLPVSLENDARAAALAEAFHGRGRGFHTVCYLTVSTGLGGAVVIGGRLYTGRTNMGAYFSRMILDGKDTSDTLISGTGLLRQARARVRPDLPDLPAFFRLFAGGDPDAAAVMETYRHNMTVLFMNISTTFNPDIIVLGGGVMQSREYFLEDVIRAYRGWVHPLARDTLIDTAVCEEPGILGACMAAKLAGDTPR